MNSTLKRALATAAVGATAALAPAAAAHADTPVRSATLTFAPPQVGRLVVVIGPVIIGGQVISQGVHVENPVVPMPTLTVTLPGWPPRAS